MFLNLLCFYGLDGLWSGATSISDGIFSLNCMLLHSFVFYSISLHGIACNFIVFYGNAWYFIVFGFFARYRTVMYRCYSANYRVVHLVIFTR